MNIKEEVLSKFKKLISTNTQSDPNSTDYPSTEAQIYFAEMLANDCVMLGMDNVNVDRWGYVTAEIPANTDNQPVIAFISHMDTSPDASGLMINPQIIENYDGNDIKLNQATFLSPSEFPCLKNYISQTLITTDGKTLLGADDKAGISEILTAFQYISENPQIKHGKIKLLFTPDEEIGAGVDHFDVKSFGADFAYTVDGGEIGELSYETFNASRVKINIKGKNVHPGSAKGIMKNASLIACIFNSLIPNEIPANTEKRDGFYHLTDIKGDVNSAYLEYIIRDFDKSLFENRKKTILDIAEKLNIEYGNLITVDIKDEYSNMGEVLKEYPEIISRAEKAMLKADVTPVIEPIRGGTDGARLSFEGLPCPNIFTGGHNFHGIYEFIPLESMEKAVEVIINIISADCQ